MFEFWCDYLKPKYNNNVKLFYIDTDSFVIYIKTEDFFLILTMMLKNGLIHLIMTKMIMDHYQSVKIKKVIGLFKSELDDQIMKEFCTLKPKTYPYF